MESVIRARTNTDDALVIGNRIDSVSLVHLFGSGLANPYIIQMIFIDNQEIEIYCKDNALTFTPDIDTCANYIYDAIYFGIKGIHMISNSGFFQVDNIKIFFNKDEKRCLVEWLGDSMAPIEFYQFQRKWDKWSKLSTFW